MVLLSIFEFHANALSLVGNFLGPCIIYLNGEAITVKQGNGVEIAKWPYNCIRQFKAEDETGKFSFVSGRRGPYGVAEYNFGLDDVSELQHALSQFTGAQFSQAPTSTYQHQQPLSQQPPLPPLPAGGHHHSPYIHGGHSQQQRPSSVSSIGRHSIGMGHRTDSVESVFTSPGHTRAHAPSTPAPRLPPRDYIHNTPSGSGTFVGGGGDALSSSAGGYAYARARNSSSTGDLLDSSLSGRSCVPQPSLGGSPHISSSNNGHYQHRQLPSGDKSPQTKAKADGGRARKSSPGTQRKSTLIQSDSPAATSTSSESRDNVPDLLPRESLTRPKTNSTGSMPTPPPPPPGTGTTHKLTKQQTAPSLSQKPFVPPKPPIAPKPTPSPKPSHLQQNKQQQPPPTNTTTPPQNSQSPSSTPEQLSQEAAVSEGGSTSTSVTPEPQLLSRSAATSGTTSPILDSADLDHIPRSSPTVMRHNRPTLKGRQSPVGKLTKSTTTPALSSETYDVPKSLHTQLSADDGGAIYNNVSLSGENPLESENTYQVPRPTVDSEYCVPRPQDDVLNEQRYYHHPKPADEIYKVPVSRPMSGTYSSLIGHTPDNLYSNPRPPPHGVGTRSPQGVYYSYPPDSDGTTGTAGNVTAQTSGGSAPDGQLYGNVTVGASNQTGGEAEENFYNVPRPGIERQKSQEKQQLHQVHSEEKDSMQTDGLYNIPRSLSDHQQGQAPETEEGLYKVPRSSMGASSSNQDGLYKVPPRAVKQSGSESPPPKNPYEMIDFDEPRKLRPARSLESLHRVKTLPPRSQGKRYVGLNVDNPSGRPVPTGWIQKQPLPPRPQQQNSSAVADNVYAEIPEDLLAKHRMANGRWSPPARGEKTFDNLYVSGPDVADSTPQPNRSLSPYDKLPPPRRPSPEVVASEGVAKAKELARQGYELCLPSGEDPRASAGGRTPPISMPPRNIPRKNFDKFDIGLRSQRSMSSSMSGSVPNVSESILGTSIPSDSTKLNADEYVIITRSDTRLKYTQTLAKSTSSGTVQPGGTASSAVPLPEGDEYEQMNSIKSQIWLNESLHYSTPNPSLYHNGAGSTSVTTTTTQQATVMSTGVGSGLGANHLYGNMEPTDKDFSNLDRVARPAAPSGEPYFVRSKTLPPRRKTVSSSSADSDVFVTPSQSSGPASIPEDEKKFVPVATHDLGGSAQLRLRSCSMDDILENGSAKPKRHSYVNVPSDNSTEPSTGEQNNKPAPPTAESAAAAVEPPSQQGPPKKPKPFPRNSLLRVESEEQAR